MQVYLYLPAAVGFVVWSFQLTQFKKLYIHALNKFWETGIEKKTSCKQI